MRNESERVYKEEMKGWVKMKRIIIIILTYLIIALSLYSADNTITEKSMVATVHHLQAERIPGLQLEVLYAGNNLPSPFVDPENLPWSSASNASSGNPGNADRDIHIAHGSDGSIWLSWDANVTNYQHRHHKSDDDGLSWDVRYYGHGSFNFQYSCITMNEAGYLRLWTTINGGSYNNDICWLESMDGWPNEIDSLDGWYIFTSGTPYH
ncbi:hypothetical protein KAX75_10965, partial [candidate division WOR-3 bacterium]|nr:hypothetical protein [candidate division WOR-3 bacterium]